MINTAPSPTQMLQARQPMSNPPAIPDDLIKLLAQLKVKQETDAQARNIAMQADQKPPTVAEKLNGELEGNARQEIAQKLGLPGLLAQGQTPPAQGQGQPPMGANGAQPMQPPGPPMPPTQGMAAGGLARLNSKLPTRYAGGGIIAFDGTAGSAVPMYGGSAMQGVSEGTKDTPSTDDNTSIFDRLMAALMVKKQQAAAYMAARDAEMGVGQGSAATPAQLPPDQAAQVNAAMAPPPAATAPVPAPTPAAPSANLPQLVSDAMAQSNGDMGKRAQLLTALGKQFGADAVDAAAAQVISDNVNKQAPAQQAPAPTGLPGAVDAAKPLAYAKTSPVQGPLEQSVIRSVSQDPTAFSQQQIDQRQAIVGGSQAAADQQRQEGIAALQKLQQQQVAQRPSTMQRGLQLMGRNIHAVGGLGAAFGGVSEGIDASNAGYTAQDIQNQTTLQGLQQAQKDALAQNDIGRWTTLESARKDAEANIRAGQTAGTSLVNTVESMNGRTEVTLARLQQAQQLATQRQDGVTLGIINRSEAAAEAQASARAKQEQAQLQNIGMPYDIEGKAAQYKAAALVADTGYQQALAKLGMPPLPTTPPATAAAPSGAGWSAKLKS